MKAPRGSISAQVGGVPGVGYAPSVPPASWLAELARPYAPAIAGAVARERFDATTRVYELAFAADVTENATGLRLPTVIHLPLAHYPSGVAYDVRPAGAARVSFERRGGLGVLSVTARPGAQEVVVSAWPR